MEQLLDLPAPLKIMLVDDHVMFSESLRESLKKMASNAEVTCFSKVSKAQLELATNDYQFLLTDILMPNEDIRLFVTFCKKTYPNLIIIALSSITDIKVVKSFFDLGINGFVTKVVGNNELKRAMEQVYNGVSYISSDLGGRLLENLKEEKETGLTARELEVLSMITAGHSVKTTASLMNISPFTVHAHRRNIMAKLDLHNVADLVRYAFEHKLDA